MGNPSNKKAEARMSVAAILLSDQSLSITDIAENLGYSSIEHFSSLFPEILQHKSPGIPEAPVIVMGNHSPSYASSKERRLGAPSPR